MTTETVVIRPDVAALAHAAWPAPVSMRVPR